MKCRKSLRSTGNQEDQDMHEEKGDLKKQEEQEKKKYEVHEEQEG